MMILDDVEFDAEYNPRRWFQIITDDDSLTTIPDGYCLVRVGWVVEQWIRDQDISLWKDIDFGPVGSDYIISNKLSTMMILKFN